jgi:hypothetical protein
MIAHDLGFWAAVSVVVFVLTLLVAGTIILGWLMRD